MLKRKGIMNVQDFHSTFGDLPGLTILAEEDVYPFKSSDEKDRAYLNTIDGFRFYKYDGGRENAGHEGSAGDCVTRAISIACELPYQDVWNKLSELLRLEYQGNADIRKKYGSFVPRQKRLKTPDKGIPRHISNKILEPLGWKFYHFTKSDVDDMIVARMIDKGDDIKEYMGQQKHPNYRERGRKLDGSYLPQGRIILAMTAHIAACINHELFDTGNQFIGRSGKRSRIAQGYFFQAYDTSLVPIEEILKLEEPEKLTEKVIKEKPIQTGKQSRNKVTAIDVPVIRQRRDDGDTFQAIANDYGVSNQCIRNIYYRNTWGHIE